MTLRRFSILGLGSLFAVTVIACGTTENGGSGTNSNGSGSSSSSSGGDYIVVDGMAGAPATGHFAEECADCHGDFGEGSRRGPEIQHIPAAYLSWIVRNGRTGTDMDAYDSATVSDAEITEIYDWLASMPRQTTGETLYLDYCGSCHGSDASGGVVGVDIRNPESDEVQEVVRQGEGSNPANRGRYMPAFSTGLLTNDELALIQDYLAGL